MIVESEKDIQILGITPEQIFVLNEQLSQLCNDEFYRKQVEAEIKEIDMKATNIEDKWRQMEVGENLRLLK